LIESHEEIAMHQLTDTFIKALRQLEEQKDVDTIVGLFSREAMLSNPTATHDSATSFWTAYRGTFDEIRSTFVGVAEADGLAFLEWESEGKIEGRAISYEGVSVLEFADDEITSFRAYFDPSKLSATLPVPSHDERSNDADVENAARDAAADREGGGYG
jgi:ketosteroid isomerase-like protein